MDILPLSKKHILFQDHLPGWDLNLHLILGKQFNYLIDTGLGSLSAEPIKQYLAQDQKPVIIVNTHYHWDHVWGNHAFDPAMIISHTLCRDMIEQKWDDMLASSRKFQKGEVLKCLPDLVFEDSLFFPMDQIRIFYTPGHTIDCISILDEEEKVLNVGDNIGDTMEFLVPSIAVDLAIYRRTLQQYQSLDIKACISGHNQVVDKDVFDTILNLLG